MHADEVARPICLRCGAKLPAGAPAGGCPACLLRLALDAAGGAERSGDEDLVAVDAEQDEAEAARMLAPLPAAPGCFADYELIEQIGRGAMGVVFKARQTSLDRFVALKILDFAGQMPRDATRRFRAEASAAAALRHPNIVTIHEVGVHHGRQYLAMDLVEGPTLAAMVARQPLNAAPAARLVAEVADAVHCAHERGILHRDLKPSNILIDARGQPHVADFGLAKRMDGDADLTIPGQIMGSPNYMSPEQARGAPLARASDVHALGALLYHCLAGRPPFYGQTIPDTLRQVAEREPVALRLLVGGVPRDLETIALKCLRKDPARRYPNAWALADDLRRFLRHEPILARPVGRFERAWRWSRRHPGLAILSATTAGLLLAIMIGSPIAALRIRAERERAQDNLYAADMNVAQQALNRSSRSQARALLERHRPAPGGIDRRGFEWRYLWGQSESDERERMRAPTGERHLVVMAEANLLAAANTVWEAGTSPETAFVLPAGSVALGYDPVRRELFVRGSEGLSAWSIATWQSRRLLAGEAVCTVAFSTDGGWLATGGETLRLWRREDDGWREMARQPRFFKEWHNAHTLAFSPDGRVLATGTGESWANRCAIELWSVPALEALPSLTDAPHDGVSLGFTPDGDRLAVGCWNGRVRMWSIDTRREVATAMRHNGFITGMAFSPVNPDEMVTMASDRTVRLWNWRRGEERLVLQGPFDQLWAMSFADGGATLLTLEKSGRVASWTLTRPERATELLASGRPAQPLGFSRDSGMLATIDDGGTLRFWRVAERREVVALRQKFDLSGVFTRDFEVIAPAITADMDRLAIGMMDGRVQLWHLPTRRVHTWQAHAENVRNASFSPDAETLATIGEDGRLKLWDAATHARRADVAVPGALPGLDFNVPLVWAPDGRALAMATAEAVLIFDAVTLRLRHSLQPSGLVYSMRFAPDSGVLVSAQDDFRISFWDPVRGTLVDTFATSHQEGVYDLSFTPDGRTLVSVVDAVKLWSVTTRQEVATLRGHERNIFAALFSPDGNTLVTADYGGAVRVWSAPPFESIEESER